MEKDAQPHKRKVWVSVIIPVKNCAKYLDDCFQSILNQTILDKHLDIRDSLLEDTLDRVEVSIWDDHSTVRLKIISLIHRMILRILY